MNFSIIAAIDENGGIGKNGNIPWNIANDLKYFQLITTGDKNKINVVIMGRITWESIPKRYRPLKDRINIVISSNKNISGPNYIFPTLNDSLFFLQNSKDALKINEIFVIGGEKLYNDAIIDGRCHKLYITHIDNNYDCDRFFPKIDPHIYKLFNEQGYNGYRFALYKILFL